MYLTYVGTGRLDSPSYVESNGYHFPLNVPVAVTNKLVFDKLSANPQFRVSGDASGVVTATTGATGGTLIDPESLAALVQREAAVSAKERHVAEAAEAQQANAVELDDRSRMLDGREAALDDREQALMSLEAEKAAASAVAPPPVVPVVAETSPLVAAPTLAKLSLLDQSPGRVKLGPSTKR